MVFLTLILLIGGAFAIAVLVSRADFDRLPRKDRKPDDDA
jgi:hypothetical protein